MSNLTELQGRLHHLAAEEQGLARILLRRLSDGNQLTDRQWASLSRMADKASRIEKGIPAPGDFRGLRKHMEAQRCTARSTR